MKEELVATFPSKGYISCNILKVTFQPVVAITAESSSMIRHEKYKGNWYSSEFSWCPDCTRKWRVIFPNVEYQFWKKKKMLIIIRCRRASLLSFNRFSTPQFKVMSIFALLFILQGKVTFFKVSFWNQTLPNICMQHYNDKRRLHFTTLYYTVLHSSLMSWL